MKNLGFMLMFLIGESTLPGAEAVWERVIKRSANDTAKFVSHISDGGYIITGISNGDVYLLKIDGRGNMRWEKSFGGDALDGGYCVEQTEDKGYIIAGYTYSYGAKGYFTIQNNKIPYGPLSDVYLIKTDSAGTLLWEKTFGYDFDDKAFFVRQTQDKGYIIVGSTFPYPFFEKTAHSRSIYIIKTDANGNLLWDRILGTKNYDDIGYSLCEVSDGYVITGVSRGERTNSYDVYLLKIDKNGNLLWQKTFGGTGYDEGRWVIQDSDKGFIITGFTFSFTKEGEEIYLIKTDSLGNPVWQRHIGEKSAFTRGYCVIKGKEGYIIAGSISRPNPGIKKSTINHIFYNETDVYVVFTDFKGNMTRTLTFGRKGKQEVAYSIQEFNNEYVLAGITYIPGEKETEIYLLKFSK